MTLSLVSFDDVKDLLDLGGANVAAYPALTVINNRVFYAFQTYLGRKLESAERAEIKYITGKLSMLHLDALPVASVSSVTAVDDYGNSETLTEDEDFAISEYGIKLLSQWQNVKITVVYTGGYSNDTVPDEIKQAAFIQAAYEFQAKEHIGAETVSTDGGTITRPGLQLLIETKRMLNPYKHPLKIN
jgi:hypothetical protein